METPKKIVKELTSNDFLNIKKIINPEKNVQGYFFAERKGVDSVAFLCYDKKRDQFLANIEYKPPIDSFIVSAFGGSLDKNNSLQNIVIEETEQEAGYQVSKDQVHYLGSVFVSTQMNQFCHLYLVFISNENKTKRAPENPVEAMAKPIWLRPSGIYKLKDWKAITIFFKATATGLI